VSAHKHTPGPWSVEQNTYGSIVCKDGKSMIAIWPEGLGGPSFPHEANARLVAAAPELLEALITKVKDAEQRSFEDWLEFNSPSGDHEAVQRQWLASNDYRGFIGEWREQLDAIAKATGGAA